MDTLAFICLLYTSNNALRPIRDIFRGGYDLDTISPKYRLVVGTVDAKGRTKNTGTKSG